MKLVLAAVAFVLLPAPAFADEPDPAVLEARACFDANGGLSVCRSILGWCDPMWGFDRRQGCAASISESWDKVMASYWGELRPIAEAFDAANNRENQPPIWFGMQAEQQAWLNFRNASCAMDLTGESIVTGPDEGRSDCRTDLTQARVEEIYVRIKWMAAYVKERQ